MLKLKIQPQNKVIFCQPQKTIAENLQEQGFYLSMPCNGKGICGKCLLKISGDLTPPSLEEKKIIKDKKGYRLACQTYIRGEATVWLPETEKNNFPKIKKSKFKNFGFAVDLGTTNIEVAIIHKKEIIPVAQEKNLQQYLGADVITRIASNKNSQLTMIIREQLNELLQKICQYYQITFPPHFICLSGNSVMSYFFYGLNPQPLGISPYKLPTKNFTPLPAQSLQLDFKNTPVYLLPLVSAFLGGDFLAGLGIVARQKFSLPLFFADLGTNGELFLMTREKKIMATSCAIGPTFEAMNISCGITYSPEAITHIKEKKGQLLLSYQNKQEAPKGLTATALIDLIAILRQKNIILNNGELASEKNNSAIKIKNNEKVFMITDKIYLSQKDIRNFQLAKAAVRAAATILLKQANIKDKKIKNIVIAGNLGKNLNFKNFRLLNFLPASKNTKFIPLGNTALNGAAYYAQDLNFQHNTYILRQRIKTIELSNDQNFNDIYLNSLDLS